MDPRVRTPAAALKAEHAMAVALFDDIAGDSSATAAALSLRNRLRDARTRAVSPDLSAAIDSLDAAVSALTGNGGGGRRGGGGRGRGGAAAQPTFTSINGDLLAMLALLEEADAEPTTQAVAAVRAVRADFAAMLLRWHRLSTSDLAALNARLRAAGQPTISAMP
jgi:Tfp pilus assembly protein FimT